MVTVRQRRHSRRASPSATARQPARRHPRRLSAPGFAIYDGSAVRTSRPPVGSCGRGTAARQDRWL